jgi:hypothetical protein
MSSEVVVVIASSAATLVFNTQFFPTLSPLAGRWPRSRRSGQASSRARRGHRVPPLRRPPGPSWPQAGVPAGPVLSASAFLAVQQLPKDQVLS